MREFGIISIPPGPIKREVFTSFLVKESEFQFHLVRLKAVPL